MTQKREEKLGERSKTPERMIMEGKVSEYGVFEDPFLEINLLDTDVEIKGRGVPRFVRDMRLKEWQHFGIVHDEYYFGMVIFDAKYMSTSFFYTYNRKTGDFFEHEKLSVLAPIRVARELWHGQCHFHHLGYLMEFDNRLDNGLHRLRVEIKEKRNRPSVLADVRFIEDLDKFEPLVVVSPVSDNRPLYTHKAACPVEGTITIGGNEIELDPAKHVGLMDVQKTFYPYDTFWKWATFGGYDEKGRLLAVNACQNFITDDEKYNENCTWVDGKITPVSAARFEFDEDDLMKPWTIQTTAGEIDLTFKPQGERVGKTNLGVLLTDFHQPFGEFEGKMIGPDGEFLDVEGMFGVCEHHLARF